MVFPNFTFAFKKKKNKNKKKKKKKKLLKLPFKKKLSHNESAANMQPKQDLENIGLQNIMK